MEGTDLSRVYPQGVAVSAAALQGEVVGVHGERLTGVVAGLVCVFVVHVIGDTDFCEQAWMDAHIIHAFLSYCGKLVAETIANCCFAYFDGKSGGHVSPA